MANIKRTNDKAGNPVYVVSASNGRGRRVKRSWRPQPGWSAKTIERELRKFAAQLENDLAAGTVETRKESLETQRLEELERQKLKTLQQYVEGVYMPAKEASLSKNALASYWGNIRSHILPALGNQLLTDITPAMIQKNPAGFPENPCSFLSGQAIQHPERRLPNGVFGLLPQGKPHAPCKAASPTERRKNR